jgi:hypothetical protein
MLALMNFSRTNLQRYWEEFPCKFEGVYDALKTFFWVGYWANNTTSCKLLAKKRTNK